MKTAFSTTRLKNSLRTILSPLLPLLRAVRTLPARKSAERIAAHLQSDHETSICYLTSQFPARPALRTEISQGGAVKLTFLAETFPHSYPKASILYAVSSVDHVAKAEIVRKAKLNGLKFILNQNGVAYFAWHGPGWEEPNRKMRTVYEQADFIIFQSQFCQESATKFLGPPKTQSQVIYNPVDTSLYQPVKKQTGNRGPILLLGGNQYEQYRFETAIQTLKQVLVHLPDAQLLVTGKLWGEDQLAAMDIARRAMHELGVEDRVEFTGSYSQQSAPGIFQRADILLHTKYNDPSPNLIAEALASGLPVVYSASGGVPELVNATSGIGIPVEPSWERIIPPDSWKMAEAIEQVWEKRSQYAEAARQCALENLSLDVYTQKHRKIFASLLEQ